MSFIEKLRRGRVESQERADPWRLRLERVQGKEGYDGIERINSQSLMDLLEIPQRARTAGTFRRLAKLMRELGWVAVKARGLTQTGHIDQVRGYARAKGRSIQM